MQDLTQLLVSLDYHLCHWINGFLTSSFFDSFFPFVTDLHHTLAFKFVLIPVIFLAFVFHHRLGGIIAFIGFVITLAAADFSGSFLKVFFQRRRPFEVSAEFIQRSPASGFSFPSNHAVNMFCMFFFLSAFFPKYRWLFFAIATVVSYSRIYNGVHFPADVIGGTLIGSVFGIVGAELSQKFIHRFDLLFKGKTRG